MFLGSDAKHRWETSRNLYGRARRQLLNIDKENCLSDSGQTNIVIEDMLTPQSKAIHRFLGKLYVPRKYVIISFMYIYPNHFVYF